MNGEIHLLSDTVLESSSVVADCAMNRERGLSSSNGYGRELGLEVLPELHRRLRDADRPVLWLDLCCGSGTALLEAAHGAPPRRTHRRLDARGKDARPERRHRPLPHARSPIRVKP